MTTRLTENSELSSLLRSGSKTPRVLILRAGAIGDTLMATPVVRALRRSLPEAFLTFICSRTAYDVLRFNPHLDQVVPLALRHLPGWLSLEKWRMIRALRQLSFDWALVLESHPSFLRLAQKSKARRLIAYGAQSEGDRLARAEFDPRLHSIENHLRAAASLGVKPAGTAMELHYPSAFDECVARRLAELRVDPGARLVGIHAGWGGRRQKLNQTRLRSWPAHRFAQIVQHLAKTPGIRVILTGSRLDQELTRYIADLAGVPALNLAGTLSLLELAALIRRLNLFITVDSGPAHMAAALGTPLLVLWGPGILAQTAPLAGTGPVRVLDHHVHCAPCYGTPLMKTCQDNICMKEITAQEAIAAAEAMLG
ncbi:MAG TPA: glycosyltransferase family 9 protein [Terriglobia bacterium]|nr:glycosyltransferase family 9 protein [Terriglobia bacterium]